MNTTYIGRPLASKHLLDVPISKRAAWEGGKTERIRACALSRPRVLQDSTADTKDARFNAMLVKE